MIARGKMKAPVASPHHPFQQWALQQITLNYFAIDTFQFLQIAARAYHRFNSMTAQSQFMNQVGTDKPGSACQKTVHERFSTKLPTKTRRAKGITNEASIDFLAERVRE